LRGLIGLTRFWLPFYWAATGNRRLATLDLLLRVLDALGICHERLESLEIEHRI